MSAMTVSDIQERFASALKTPRGGVCPEFLDESAKERFHIYRNNFYHGLSETLGDAYPVVRRLVGDEFFRAMAVEYVGLHPPKTRSLALFGDVFPIFLSRFPPVASLHYLPDVAHLERATLESRHAEDTPPLSPERAAQLGAAVVGARLTPHPATRLITSPFPIADIWHDNQPGTAPTPSRPRQAARGGALVTRLDFTVSVQRLGEPETAFTKALLRGDEVAAAFAAAAVIDSAFDLGTAFRTLLTAGAFADIDAPDTHPPTPHD